jgi:CelD/BcsL family acetyltransferase involved in cellulose biosynthesis
LIDDVTHLAQLEDQWEALAARLSDHDALFFQSHAWSMHVAQTRLQRSARRYRLCVAAVREGGRLIGIWPLALHRVSGAWIARGLDEPFGQFAGVVFENPVDISAGVAAVSAALREAGVADGLQLDNVIEGTPLHQALVERGARDRPVDDAIYVDMRGFASFAAYAIGFVNKKTRKNLRNLLSRLKRAAEVRHTVADGAGDLRPMLTQAFDARLNWMQHHARTSPAFRNPDFRAVVEGLLGARGIHLLGFSLAAPQSELSTQWGFRYRGRYYAYMSAKNPQFDEFSPGRLHLEMVIEACKERGIDILELMAPAADYKLTWSERRRRLHNVTMPFTLKGYLVLNVLAGKLLPATRTASRLLPHAVRRLILNPLLGNRAG